MGLGNIAAWSRICLLWRTPPFAGHAKKSRTTEDRRGNREEGERDQEGYPHPLPPLVLNYAAQLTAGAGAVVDGVGKLRDGLVTLDDALQGSLDPETLAAL